jgi:hypothetical protein
VAVVHPAGQHDVATPEGEFVHRVVDRDQRRRTRGIHRVGRSPQVQPVGDARCREVRHEPDGRLRTELAERFEQGGPQAGQHFGTGRRYEFAHRAGDLPYGAHPLVETQQPGGQVAAATEDHPHPGPVTQPVEATGVVHRGDGRGEGGDLVGFHAVDVGGRDAERDRVEVHCVRDEAAAVSVGTVRTGSVATVELAVPPPVGDLGDGVDTGDQVVPVGVKALGAGQDDTHPDDRHRLLGHHSDAAYSTEVTSGAP